jgi:uncharacterized protein DUF6804
MKKAITENAITVLIKLSVTLALIIAATTQQEYSYYTFIRWLVMVSFIYFAYQSYTKHQVGLIIFFIAAALLFNPFIKFWFQKSTWHLIDCIVAGITLATVIFAKKIDDYN